MDDIYLLVDYKGHFGTKHGAVPYRSGLGKEKLASHFARRGYRAVFMNFCDVDFRDERFRRSIVLYSSSEDRGLHYRSFIEDVVLGLEVAGALVLPAFKFLRAHHNKVFMEILLSQIPICAMVSLPSHCYGTLEDFESRIDSAPLPGVVKPAAGSMSAGLRLGRSRMELRKAAAAASSTPALGAEAWDFGRMLRRKGYVRESRHRGKFVVQRYLPGLENDWKVLVYGKNYYALFRKIRDSDFRASGSGRFEFIRDIPAGLLDFASLVKKQFDVPHLSLDIGWDGSKFHLFEFQALHFGTLTVEQSPFHFVDGERGWQRIEGRSEVEEEFARSIVDHIQREGNRLNPIRKEGGPN
jgi:hypothetical protein